MSDDERSDSGSGSDDGEDLQTTGLIATRAKRSTAGNLYASLRANLDDEELQKDLLAEDEDEDAADYVGSDKDDEDDALESSSDEEDAGPPKEGEEDLQGEKELKKAERAEVRKKRKVQDARLKLPSWQKKNKKVKLADDVKTEDGASASSKPKKKSERANWLPTVADAPTRQSGRALAVANREVTHANLKQSYERSEKQRRVMKDAAQREPTKKRRDISQEDRVALCDKIAKQTDREFGRWERDEKEKQRLRDEALAAKRNKGFEGPYIRHLSGSALWEGDRIKVRRVEHGSRKVEETLDEPNAAADGHVDGAAPSGAGPSSATTAHSSQSVAQSTVGVPPTHPQSSAAQPPVPWLQGIHDYAARPPSTPQQQQPTSSASHITAYNVPTPIAPSMNGTTLPQTAPTSIYSTPQTPYTQQPPNVYGSWPPGAQSFAVQPPAPPPPAPLVREQAQRSLIILEQFEELDALPKRNKTASTLEPTSTASAILADSYPPFNADEIRYLTTKHFKRAGGQMPLPPAKPYCAILSHKEARFRDPKTGLCYYDMHTYKIIQRVLASGCSWSGLLGAWTGPAYGGMGRPAKGVPEGFASGVGRGRMGSGGAGVKVEGGG